MRRGQEAGSWVSVSGLGQCDVSVFGLHDRGTHRGGVETERQPVRFRGGVFLDPKGDFAGLLVIWGGFAWTSLPRGNPPASGRGRGPAQCVCMLWGETRLSPVQREGPRFPICGSWAVQAPGPFYSSLGSLAKPLGYARHRKGLEKGASTTCQVLKYLFLYLSQEKGLSSMFRWETEATKGSREGLPPPGRA